MNEDIYPQIEQLDNKFAEFLKTRRKIGKFENKHRTRSTLQAAASQYKGYFRKLIAHTRHEEEPDIPVDKLVRWGQPIVDTLDDVQKHIVRPLLARTNEIGEHLNNKMRPVFGPEKIKEFQQEAQKFSSVAKLFSARVDEIASKHHHWHIEDAKIDELVSFQKALYAQIRKITDLVKELKDYTEVALESKAETPRG